MEALNTSDQKSDVKAEDNNADVVEAPETRTPATHETASPQTKPTGRVETNTKCTRKPVARTTLQMPPVPPDGGYGWVILFSSFMINLIVDGVCFTFGIFFIRFNDYFNEGEAKTAWVGSILNGMYLSMG